MTDDPFGDLDKDMGEAMEDDEGSATDNGEPNTESESGSEPKSEYSTDSRATSEANPQSTPAFEFSETGQEQFYVRGGTWNEWEKARDAQLKPSLVMDDVEDVRGSEIHDAVVQFATDHPEEVAEYVKQARGIDDE